ncbi:hypothetical protein BGW39_009459, partial [Mortierella sp. 14UC]
MEVDPLVYLDTNVVGEGDPINKPTSARKHDINQDTEGNPKKHKPEAGDRLDPNLQVDLDNFRMQRLEESRQRIYIPVMAKPNLQARDDSLFPLMDKVQKFLAGQRQVFLVLGDSGAGKSIFNLELEHALWKDYKNDEPIPLYINLPYIDNPAQDLIEKQLQYHNFTEEQILELKQHHQFILICDGYDESQLTVNLHQANRLNQRGQWRAKMVISCRSQFLGPIYTDRFVPQGREYDQRPALDLFQEAVIAPFSKEQVK